MAEKPPLWLEELNSLAHLNLQGCSNTVLSLCLLPKPFYQATDPFLGKQSPFYFSLVLDHHVGWQQGPPGGWGRLLGRECVDLGASRQLLDLGHYWRVCSADFTAFAIIYHDLL